MTITWTTAELEADMVNGKTFAAGEWETHLNTLADSLRTQFAELESQIAALTQQVAELTTQVAEVTALKEKIGRARGHVTAAAQELTDGT